VNRKFIKNTLLALGAIILANCSAVGLKSSGAGFLSSNLWINSFSKVIFGYPDYPISREMVENIPYASLRIKIGKGPAGLMILQKIEGNTLSWISRDEVLIQTKNGRIVRTSKLNNDLSDYYYDTDPEFIEILEEKKIKSQRVISLTNPKASHIELQVTSSTKDKKETIEILGNEYELIKISEKIHNRLIKWKYTNTYWVDSEGFVWKTIQQIAPNVPPIVIEVTKPYSA
tara:strand:+ start:916 stop:1605 length:690 start_codon:yes stop_codon:yes gene_type:complete